MRFLFSENKENEQKFIKHVDNVHTLNELVFKSNTLQYTKLILNNFRSFFVSVSVKKTTKNTTS